MTNPNDNPHQDFRRQTDQHYGLNSSTAPPPRISREGTGTPPAAEPVTESIRIGPHPEDQQPALPTTRFSAGTTYSGRSAVPGAGTEPSPSNAVAPPPQSQQQVMPVMPSYPDGVPTQQIPIAAPEQRIFPVITPTAGPAAPPQIPPLTPPPPNSPPQQQAMPVTPPPYAAPGTQIPAPSSAHRFDFQPTHAMWALTVLAGLCALLSGVGWILVVGGCAYGAWYLGQRGTPWPDDIRDLLARFSLATPAQVQPVPSAGAAAPAAPIPFRPMNFSELFTGAFKVVSRNWPTLVGIPFVLLFAAGLAAGLVILVMVQITVASADSLLNATNLGPFVALFAVFALLLYAAALPLDALLIALGVITTDKAVRGERIRLTNVLALARKRMLAVTRLTLAFYSIIIITDLIFYAIVITAVMSSSIAAGIFFYLLLLAANFVLGILFSLAPIVVVTEQRGVMDSFKRSIQLVKSAWGRILAIHLLWMACVTPILMVPSLAISFILGPLGTILFMIIGFSFALAYTRTLQVLVYTDLRMRQERYEHELIADWARNTGVR